MRLEGKSLTFRYRKDRKPVLEGITISIESGERLGLAGPSGRGKTTLCRLLAGYETPTSGEVLLDGTPLSAWKGPCPVQLLWQNPETAVDPRMRMDRVLAEGGPVAPELLEALGIEPDWLKRWPGELSGGELQRFCLARALGPATKILLCDEMSAMLDYITQAQLWEVLLAEAERRDLGLLVVSHSGKLLERVCTRVITL
ncbi:ATP-binding cassette domain-containing protein [Pseudoflavonifractor phocaeensis]|uniref:ATP-binding cassette domain-containing protein n=1 Tax=Pseudoflavonifractor phocaeensis TaxID=1870988 RepID=UPI00195A6D24|nr:ATP-binding cassette domain-containing protein [Pseudoflavonifractor phocaeensis]